ncbi:MAG: GH116 family glycosyl hydrolase [Candidatus Woesearchaeota archaeon]|nr:GH116 family glycosyl hydrolase [Candidatus Woesearchaeota archaeon]
MDKKEIEKNTLERAYKTAIHDLRKCYTGLGILAGLRRFDDYWARDSFFASFGALSIKDFSVVKRNLGLFLKYKKEDGQLPRRIDRHVVFLKYLKIPKFLVRRKKLMPKYTTSLGYCYSVDQNSLFVIALLEYVKKTGDVDFLKKTYKEAKQIIDWNFSNDRERDLLLEEGFFANWEDTIFWRGKLFYTNILHYKALLDFSELSAIVGDEENKKRYYDIAEKVKSRINRSFWHYEYYIKSKVRKWKHAKYFCIDANLLSIVFGIADREKTMHILKYIKKFNLDEKIPMRSTYPRYPLWRNSPARLVLFSAGYHDVFGWIWISCLYALALHKIGMKKEALCYLNKTANKINEFNGVYEVYSNGRPVDKILFKSDYPFAWSAGMFIYTYNVILKSKNN